MVHYVSAYLVALAIFLIIDGIWLGLVARNFYVSRMGDLLLDRPRFFVAFLFYAIFVAGMVYFAIGGGLNGAGWQGAAFDGGLFGFFAYLTYNATNLATLKGFDPVVAVVDTFWGATLGAAVSGLTVAIVSAFL